ncbi:MAG: TRAP transporter small permease [Lachnospirales bacterium]
MKNLREILDKTVEWIGVILLAIMVLTVLWQVFTRTVLNNPNTITEEFVRFSLVWLSLLASAYVVGKQAHLNVSLLSDTLSGKNKFKLEIVIQVLFLLFSLIVMIFGGLKGVSITMGQISPSLGLPMGYVYLAVPVSGVIMLVYSVMNLIDRIKEEKGL